MSMSEKATLTFRAYCGLHFEIEGTAFRSEINDLRMAAARRIRSARRDGACVSVLKAGRRWEFETPEDACLVADTDGLMVLTVPADGMADDEDDDGSECDCDDGELTLEDGVECDEEDDC